MKHLRNILIILLFSVVFSQKFAQDIHFSLPSFTKLHMNPGNAGVDFDQEAAIIYRGQWSSVNSDYRTVYAEFSSRLGGNSRNRKGYFGIGATAFNDKSATGHLSQSMFSPMLSYHVFINDYFTLGTGLQGGLGQSSVNLNGLNWGNQFDGTTFNSAINSYEQGRSSNLYLDLSAGIVLSYKTSSNRVLADDESSFSIGFSSHHINQPKYTFQNSSTSKLSRKYTLFGLSNIAIPYSKLSYSPSFYVYNQSNIYEVMFGSFVNYRIAQASKYTGYFSEAKLAIGAFYRVKDAVIASSYLYFGSLAVGITYDFTTSSLSSASNYRGGFELSIRWMNPFPFRSVKARF